MTSSDLEQRIRDRAHQIWEDEGRPEGAQDRHWEQARLEVEAEDRIGATDTDEDTELTSSLATMDDPITDIAVADGGMIADADPAAAEVAGSEPDPLAEPEPEAPAAKPVRKRAVRKASTV